MTLLAKYDVWLDRVRELMGERHSEFPRDSVAQFLDATIESAVVSWSWADANGNFGTELNRWPPGTGWPSRLDADWAQRVTFSHPLMLWFLSSLDPRPMSVDRVPRSAIPAWAVPAFREVHAPMGVGHQLSIPYRLGNGPYRAFVLGRSGEDFSADDLELVRRIQPLLALLERQVTVLQELEPPESVSTDVLTGRETAVLHLLSHGHTAEAIAHRLGISPRTVHSHLQRIYRKLGVGDRLRAVLAACSLGILTPVAHGRSAGQVTSRQGVPADGDCHRLATQPELIYTFSVDDLSSARSSLPSSGRQDAPM